MRETAVSLLTFLHLYKIAHVYEILVVAGGLNLSWVCSQGISDISMQNEQETPSRNYHFGQDSRIHDILFSKIRRYFLTFPINRFCNSELRLLQMYLYSVIRKVTIFFGFESVRIKAYRHCDWSEIRNFRRSCERVIQNIFSVIKSSIVSILHH